MSKAIRLARAPIWVACAGLYLTPACGAEWSKVTPCDSQALLRLNEAMVRPVSGRSADQWVEIVNRGETEAGTDGLVVDVLTPTRAAAHPVSDGTALAPGEHGLLVRATEALNGAHGGLAPTLNLPKRQATVRLRCGETVLDTWCYGCDATPVPRVGHSLMRDVSTAGASLARDAAARALKGDATSRVPHAPTDGAAAGPAPLEPSWCVAHGPPYDGVNVGTPGLPNTGCARCTDGDGKWRDVRGPGAGDLLLKEFVPRPASGAADAWLEVYGGGEQQVDLNGLVITVTAARGAPKRYAYDKERCLTVSPGASAALGLGKAGTRTGAVPVTAVFEGPRVPNHPVRLALAAAGTDVAVVAIEGKRQGQRRGENADPQTSDAPCAAPCASSGSEGAS